MWCTMACLNAHGLLPCHSLQNIQNARRNWGILGGFIIWVMGILRYVIVGIVTASTALSSGHDPTKPPELTLPPCHFDTFTCCCVSDPVGLIGGCDRIVVETRLKYMLYKIHSLLQARLWMHQQELWIQIRWSHEMIMFSKSARTWWNPWITIMTSSTLRDVLSCPVRQLLHNDQKWCSAVVWLILDFS